MRTIVLVCSFCFMWSCTAQDHVFPMNSPDGSIQVELKISTNQPTYTLSIDGHPIIRPSDLGFQLRSEPDRQEVIRMERIRQDTVRSTWEQVVGANKKILDHHHSYQYVIWSGDLEYFGLEFKVFDDGVGFRYAFPQWPGQDSLLLENEMTEFNFAEDFTAWWIPNNWDSYEQLYQTTPISQVSGVNTPVTLRTSEGIHLSVHEANLTEYSGMTLVADAQGSLDWHAELVPWPDGLKVRSSLPHVSPWRTLQLARSAAELANSNLILNLNEPSKLHDVSWIRPMKYMGIWWGMHIKTESWVQGPIHGATTENAMRYIDYASDHGFQGLLIEGWNLGWENWGAKNAYSFTIPYDDFDIERVTAYAAEHDMEIIGHHETGGDAESYDLLVDEAFQYYKKLGINSIKTGYAGSIYPRGQHHHGQWMVRHYRRVLELAAHYQITLDVHEPIKPTGLRRTYPNMLTREGARGNEYEAWSEGNPPEHTVILPFTRLLAGPMDYTPGIFNLTLDGIQENHRVHSTLGKQLALLVILNSPLQMVADLPEHINDHPAMQYVRDLDIDWDESMVLAGEVGQYVATARRTGDEWFLSAITGEAAHELMLPMSRLIETEMVAQCYIDRESTHWDHNPYPLWIGSYRVTPGDTLQARLAAGGGMAMRLIPMVDSETDLPPISQLRSDQQH